MSRKPLHCLLFRISGRILVQYLHKIVTQGAVRKGQRLQFGDAVDAGDGSLDGWLPRVGISSESMRLRSVQAIYSQFAEDYEHVMRNDMQYTAHVEVPQLVINALGHQRANILDLGCGTGLSSLPFLERGWQVTGIDGTISMLHRAQELPYTELIQQDLESPWRVRDRSFDGIVMIGVMEYIANPGALFRQARRKLVDSGVFGVTVPYKSKPCTEANLRTYYKKEIVPVILTAGFTIESCVKTLGFNDAGTRVHYCNYLLRKG